MKSKFPALSLLSAVLTTGCAQLAPPPPALPPALTLSELRSELAGQESQWQQVEQHLQQQNKEQQAALKRLQDNLTNVNGTLAKMQSKLNERPVAAPKAASVAVEKLQPTTQSLAIDGKMLVGEAEWLWVDVANDAFQARVDTGATTSSISAQGITIFERNGKNWVRFFMSHKDLNEQIQIEAPLVRHVRVRQASAEDLDRRPVVRLAVRMGEMTEKAEFTLKDRSDMTYPVLLGREFLKDIAVVDVAREYIQPKPKLKESK
ncbi:MAG: ATP-dependent zinc protease family protein [Aeromonas sp.]